MWCFSSRTLPSFFQTAGRLTRRSARLPGLLASRLAQRRGTNGRHNIRLEPSRLTVPCRSCRRGARLKRSVIRTENERHRIVFHLGRLRLLVGSRGAWLLRRARAPRGVLGKRRPSDLSVATSDETSIRLLRAMSVVRIRSASGARYRALSAAARRRGVRKGASCPVLVRRAGLFNHLLSSRTSCWL